MKKCKFYQTLITVLCFILGTNYLLTGCTRATENSSSLETVTLKLKWKHQFQFAGYYMALEKGYYRDAGLNVVIVEAADQEESTQAVLNGDAQFGIGSSDLVVARAKGEPIVMLAPIFQHSALVLLIKQNTGITHVHDLVGKRVMLEPHSDELLAYLKNEGISQDQLIIYPHSFDTSPLITNEVDAMSAYTTDEPFVFELNQIPYQIFSPRSSGIDFYGDTLFTSEEQVRLHPERVQAFLYASLRGWKYALNNVDETVDVIVSRYSPRHSAEHLKFEADAIQKLVIPDVVEIGYVNPGRWENIADVYAELGIIPRDHSLEGFIYERSEPEVQWFNIITSGIAVIVVLIFMIGLSGVLTKIISLLRRR